MVSRELVHQIFTPSLKELLAFAMVQSIIVIHVGLLSDDQTDCIHVPCASHALY